MPKPSKYRTNDYPWPFWPVKLKTSSSHEEGSKRKWSVLTKEFIGNKNGHLKSLKTIEIEWGKTSGQKPKLEEIPGSEKEWPCELALLALGFTGPEKSLPEQFGVELNKNGHVFSENNYQTNKSNIFVAGDCRRGQSLIVWAISEGREAAFHIDMFLMGKSNLSQKNNLGDLIQM
jgi:glutamate synthase (NADPH/NADH) small chain